MSAQPTSPSLILHNPVSESSTLSRRRTFTLAQLRNDFRDAQTQLVVLLTQLHDEHLTGALTIHLNQGRVCSIEVTESKKIDHAQEIIK